MYCQNCGSEIERNASVCPYCGQANSNSDTVRIKDIKIQELEQKIAKLEQVVKERSNSTFKKNTFSPFQPWFFIIPIVFVIVFFVFFILLINLT